MGSPSNQPEETEGESFAKKIVSEILGRSVTRFTDSLVAEEGKEHPPAKGEGEEHKSPHDNYINYDIAQTVLESTARSKSLSPTPGMWWLCGWESIHKLADATIQPHYHSHACTHAHFAL